MRIFCLNLFGLKNPFWLLINRLKYTRIWFWFQISQDIPLFVPSTLSQFSNRFILCILSINTVSFRIFHEYAQRKSDQRFIFSPCILISVYEPIHSAYSRYTVRTDSFMYLGGTYPKKKFKYLEYNYFLHSFIRDLCFHALVHVHVRVYVLVHYFKKRSDNNQEQIVFCSSLTKNNCFRVFWLYVEWPSNLNISANLIFNQNNFWSESGE